MNTIIKSITFLSAITLSYATFAASSPEQCEMNGVDYKLAKKFIVNVQKAIKTNDQKSLADMANYPLKINKTVPAGVETTVIKNKDQFLKQYDKILTDEVKKNIIEHNPDSLFCNQQGGMIAEGTLWFMADAGKAGFFVINN